MANSAQITDLFLTWHAPGAGTDIVFPHTYLCSLQGDQHSPSIARIQAKLTRLIADNGGVGAVIAATGPAGSFDNLTMRDQAAFMRGIRFMGEAEEGPEIPF